MSNSTDKLILNPSTKRALASYLLKPGHALLVLGPEGSGKKTFARAVASELLGADDIAKATTHPFFRRLSRPEGKRTIPIEDLRAALNETKLKNPTSQGKASRVIFIEDASNLGMDAQNVLLKDLEEPSPGTFFIITANSANDVLPTIASRCQKLKLAPITQSAAINHFSGYSESQVRSAWALAGGATGTLVQLLEEGNEHKLKAAVNEVKSLTGKPVYEKMLYLEKLSNEREKLQTYIVAQQKVLEALHHSAIKRGEQSSAEKLLAKRAILEQLNQYLGANANARLVVTQLAIEV